MEINKIYNQDCMDLLPTFPDKSIDLIVTDPPYEVNTSPSGKTCLKSIHKIETGLDDIKKGFNIEKTFGEFQRVLKKVNIFCFCSNNQIPKIMNWGIDRGFFTTLLVWHKTNTTPFCCGVWRPDVEYCVHIREKGATFQGDAKQKEKVYVSPTVRSQTGHPTEKPLSLIKRYIEIGSNEGDVILDPFSGSGTTACACYELKRKFICIEKDFKYYESSIKRFETFSKQGFLW